MYFFLFVSWIIKHEEEYQSAVNSKTFYTINRHAKLKWQTPVCNLKQNNKRFLYS